MVLACISLPLLFSSLLEKKRQSRRVFLACTVVSEEPIAKQRSEEAFGGLFNEAAGLG